MDRRLIGEGLLVMVLGAFGSNLVLKQNKKTTANSFRHTPGDGQFALVKNAFDFGGYFEKT